MTKTPTAFGSHQSMVVKTEDTYVVCEDGLGQYRTTKDRLDNGLADPNRYDWNATYPYEIAQVNEETKETTTKTVPTGPYRLSRLLNGGGSSDEDKK